MLNGFPLVLIFFLLFDFPAHEGIRSYTMSIGEDRTPTHCKFCSLQVFI